MICIEHVHKRFGKVRALEDVSLEIAPGERVALVGSNGSGKTTLLRAVCGLLRVEGKILIEGLNVATHPELALRTLAYVPQHAPPLDAPVHELVRAHCAISGYEAKLVASYCSRLQLNLDTVRTSRVRDLSGGTKQKLLSALALASTRRILVCDEPTASLDHDARSALLACLEERPEGSTLIICCHRLDEVHTLVDRVIEMHEGRVLTDEPSPRRAREAEALERASGSTPLASIRRVR